jgi:hypothetical protein
MKDARVDAAESTWRSFERRYKSWSEIVAFSHTNKPDFDREMAETRAKCGAR